MAKFIMAMDFLLVIVGTMPKKFPCSFRLAMQFELHHIQVQQLECLGETIQGCGRRQCLCGCNEHRKSCWQGIVQVYVHDHKSKLVRPSKELKGFTKVELGPGETKTVTIALDFRSFAYYDPAHKGWVTEDGDFDILIGSSSTDICFSETVTLSSSLTLPCLLDRESTIRDWQNDPRGKEVFKPMYEMMAEGMKSAMGSGDDGSEFIGMDVEKFLLEMPLLSILQFQEGFLPKPAVEIVDELLEQVHGK